MTAPLAHKLRGIRDSLPPGYILGRSSPGNGPPELIKLTDFVRSPAVMGAINAVTNAALTIASLTVMGNPSAVTDVATGMSITALLDFLTGAVATAAARGSLIFRGAAAWTVLAPGTAGQVLQSGGAGADPSWTTFSSGDYSALSLGTEPATIVTDGAGAFITVPISH